MAPKPISKRDDRTTEKTLTKKNSSSFLTWPCLSSLYSSQPNLSEEAAGHLNSINGVRNRIYLK